ncbi:MAG: GNAT family N-acetyltransferase, partial [Candidatus Micrarchaeota archaeon]|nr:GNAT family N-acetyltransferase [Candidatus Micrarchaeota archaeon]
MRKSQSKNSLSEIKLRAYEDKDYRSLREVLKEAGLFYRHWDSQASLRKKISISPGSVIVAVRDNKVIGCEYAISEIGGFLVQLAVRRQFRNQGVGERLLKAGEDFLKKKGVREVLIWADTNNANLLEYYKKRGYKLGNV